MRRNRELYMALLAILGITALYLTTIARVGLPAASSLIGHSLGILGFLLMLMTETLYSFRKRAVRRPWGKMSEWLRFHIFTGIVGPYLVFLHSAWSFRGLAGVVLLLTGVVVLSGFVGRYIYTLVPRTADGLIVEAEALRAQIEAMDAELRRSAARRQAPHATAFARAAGPPLRREERAWRGRLPGRAADGDGHEAAEFEALVRRRNQVRRQMASIAGARRMLAVWHSVHIPLGVSLFAAAFVHIGAAIYYATLLR